GFSSCGSPLCKIASISSNVIDSPNMESIIHLDSSRHSDHRRSKRQP
ncbi:hypothetical protein NPIL_656811, partial [Nephila pilipes]